MDAPLIEINEAPPLVEILLCAEGKQERRVMAIALIYPKTIIELSKDWMPEIDLTVKEFWRKFQSKRNAIMDADDDGALELVMNCCSYKDRLDCLNLVRDINTYRAAHEIFTESKALRMGRKAMRFIEASELLGGSGK
jgi:hypothetical protein